MTAQPQPQWLKIKFFLKHTIQLFVKGCERKAIADVGACISVSQCVAITPHWPRPRPRLSPHEAPDNACTRQTRGLQITKLPWQLLPKLKIHCRRLEFTDFYLYLKGLRMLKIIQLCSLDVNLTVAAPLYSEMYSAVASLSCQNAWLGWAGPGPLVPVSLSALLRPQSQSVSRVGRDSRVAPPSPAPPSPRPRNECGHLITRHRSDHRYNTQRLRARAH